MSQTIQIPPEQLPQFIAQHKAQKEALEKVITIKQSVMEHLEAIVQLTSPEVAPDDLPVTDIRISIVGTCFHHFALAQLIEYELQLKGFTEKLDQTNEILTKVESPIVAPSGPTIKLGGGFRPPKI